MQKTITKKSDELREITSAVLVPEEGDWHGDIYSNEEVHKAERNFSKYCKKANLQHNKQLDEDMAQFVESYILPEDMICDGRVVKKGTWLATMKVKSDALWDEVKKGTFTGFSIGCKALHQAIAKSKGTYDGTTPIKAHTRLTDFNFEDDFCHVALVDEAANNTTILVTKAKEARTESKTPQPNKAEESKKQKDDDMSFTQEEVDALVLKAKEDAAVTLEQEVAKSLEKEEAEVTKAKELAEEIETLKAFKADAEAKAEEVAKAKLESDKADMVVVAKSMTGICSEETSEEFGHALFAVKSLCPDQYEIVKKALDQANENLTNLEFVAKEAASSEEAPEVLEGEALIKAKAAKLIEADPKMPAHKARTKARELVRKEAKKAQSAE